MTPEQHAEWSAAMPPSWPARNLMRAWSCATPPRGPRTWGVRIAPDGQVVLNPAQLDPQVYAEMEAARDKSEPEAEPEIG